MENGKKAALAATAIAVLAVGVRLGLLVRERHAAVAPVAAPERRKLPDDAYVFLKKRRPSTPADLKDLFGTTVWMSAGGQMDYFPVQARRADYAKKAGTLPAAQPLAIVGELEQVAPKSATFRIPGGDRQVLLTFHLPPSAQGPGEGDRLFAVPVGYHDAGLYTFLTDEMFFYDDPHELYKHWGPEVWSAIDHHQVVRGMTETQAQMALGQVFESAGGEMGERRVTFHNNGHPVDVDFRKNRATAVTPHL